MTKVLRLCVISLINVKTNRYHRKVFIEKHRKVFLANVMLKHNYFELGKDIIKRLPSSLRKTIGRKFTPHYADIFMVGSEEEIFEKFHFQPTFGCVICMIFSVNKLIF